MNKKTFFKNRENNDSPMKKRAKHLELETTPRNKVLREIILTESGK